MKTGVAFVLAVFSSLLVGRSVQESVVCGKKIVNHPEKDKWNYDGEMYSGQWPWSSAIYTRKDNGTVEFICGGALISSKHVITSRLCVTGESGALLEIDKLRIRVGTHNHNVLNFGKAQHRNVFKIHQPIDDNVTSRNEVALLEMKVKVKFNDYVQPVCMNKPNQRVENYRPIIGWGFMKGHKHLGTNLDVIYLCRASRIQYDHRNELCQTDRGSFAYEYNEYDKSWYIFGVIDCESVSCEGNKMNGFIDVADYLLFIKKHTNLEYLQRIRKGRRFDPRREYPNILPQRNCGHYFDQPNKNDTYVHLFEFPWIAQLGYYDHFYKKWTFESLGTLISYRYVLTTATRYKFSLFFVDTVRLGNINRAQLVCDSEDEAEYCLPVRDYDVEYCTVHPDWDRFREEPLFINNVALVRTAKTVVYEDHIHPICLPISHELRQLKLPEYVVAGWNLINKKSPHLQKAPITTANGSKCCGASNDYDSIQYALEEYPEMHLCVKNIVTEYRQFEPLGQYVDNHGTRFVQFAIYQGTDTLENFSLYTNISYFMDWIIANVEE